MAGIGRKILAVVAGFALWGILWNLGTTGAQAALPTILAPDRPIEHTGALWGLIAYSVVLSVLVGYVAAMIAGAPAALALAIVNLAVGIIAEISYWDLMPVWYHLIFLLLVAPSTLFGGVLHSSLRQVSAETDTNST